MVQFDLDRSVDHLSVPRGNLVLRSWGNFWGNSFFTENKYKKNQSVKQTIQFRPRATYQGGVGSIPASRTSNTKAVSESIH
jgi:hypothetical protein